MLLQFHHQFRDGRTEMKAQKRINNHAELRAYIKEINKSHPLPKGVIWMWCEEGSKHFLMTTEESLRKASPIED